MSESGWQRLKNVQRRSRENVCGLVFLLWSALMFSEPESATWNTQRERVKSLDAYESTARHRPRLTQRGTAGSKRWVLRNYIQLYKSKQTFLEHLCRLSCNLRHFTVQHKNMVGGITLYSLRSHQLTLNKWKSAENHCYAHARSSSHSTRTGVSAWLMTLISIWSFVTPSLFFFFPLRELVAFHAGTSADAAILGYNVPFIWPVTPKLRAHVVQICS